MGALAAALWLVIGLSLFAWVFLANRRFASAVASHAGSGSPKPAYTWLDLQALATRQSDRGLEVLRRRSLIALAAFAGNLAVGCLVVSLWA